MNIVVVCAGGYSSSIVMKKIVTWGKEHGEEIVCTAVGIASLEGYSEPYDCVLVAPQASYHIDTFKEYIDKPILTINPMDYAIANADTIMEQVYNALNREENKNGC